MRTIESVYVITSDGIAKSPAEAIALITSIDRSRIDADTLSNQFEVGVRYNNGDEIRGQFNDKSMAIAFLRGMR